MSKTNDKTIEEEPRDEPTAKHLHKLAENGKARGLPASLVAQYEKMAWEATKSDKKYTSCEKCGMPPPPPIESAKKTEENSSETCKACGNVNKKPIGLESELAESARKEQILKKKEEKKSLKRSSDVINTPTTSIASIPRKVPPPSSVRTMARKVAPQPNLHLLATPPAPPLLLQSKSSKKAKRPKLAVEKEPDFLQALLKVGGNPL